MKRLSEPLILGDKSYYKYLIVWEDILGDSSIAEHNAFYNMKVATIHTEAYIFKKDNKYVHSFASYQNENGDIAFGDRNVYPRSVIKKMVRI